MGLKNVSLEAQPVKYNGVELVLQPGDVVDVRDFNINNSEVTGVEDILLNKHRDSEGKRVFEQIKTISNMTNAQINEEIEKLKVALEDARKESEIKDKEVLGLNEENNNLKTELANAKDEIEKLKKKLAK